MEKDFNNIKIWKEWKLKKPTYEEHEKMLSGDTFTKTFYSLQVLEKNNLLPVSIRVAQNIVLHNMHIFEKFGVYKNKKGTRLRFYCSEFLVYQFCEELTKFKYTHQNKEGLLYD